MEQTDTSTGRGVASDATAEAGRHKGSLTARALEEVRRFVVLFVYLWVLFGLFALHERVILHENGLNFTRQGVAILNALVMAKVMLVAEDLRLGRLKLRAPLILPILIQSCLFAVLFLAFHIFEHVIIGMIAGAAAAASVPAIGGGGLPGLACVSAILFFALIPYFAYANLGEVLGHDRLRALLLDTAAYDAREPTHDAA
jgi:hypothetical protein